MGSPIGAQTQRLLTSAGAPTGPAVGVGVRAPGVGAEVEADVDLLSVIVARDSL